MLLTRASVDSVAKGRPMNVAANKQILLDFYAAGESGDLDTCLALLANDIRWTNIGSTVFSGTFRGKQALVDELLGPLFGRLKTGISSSIENMIGEGDWVVVQTSGMAETLDGEPYNNSYCQVIKIQDGKISEVKEYFDTQLTQSVFGPG